MSSKIMQELWNRDFIRCPFCNSDSTFVVSEMKTNPENEFYEEFAEVVCCAENRLIDKAWNFNRQLVALLQNMNAPKCVTIKRYIGKSFEKEEIGRVIDMNGVEFIFGNSAILIEKNKEHKVERLRISQQNQGEFFDVTLNSIIQLVLDDETSDLEIFLEWVNS